MNIFEAVKSSVTTRQAAESYGIRVNRNGMALCPFHPDKHPSMKLDGRFHCFGCQADGDVIDFTAKLFGLPVKEAAEKLAADFGIHYEEKEHGPPRVRTPAGPKLSKEKLYQEAEDRTFCVYCEYRQALDEWQKAYAPGSPDEEWHPLFTEALQRKDYIDYLLDILLYGSAEEKAELIADRKKEVITLEQRLSELTAHHTAEA